jgi:hypothetical protein
MDYLLALIYNELFVFSGLETTETVTLEITLLYLLLFLRRNTLLFTPVDNCTLLPCRTLTAHSVHESLELDNQLQLSLRPTFLLFV